MAMQAGVGLSRIFLLAGAGYTGTIMMKNGKLSDLLGELQSLVKGVEKSGDGSEGDSDFSDAVAAQISRLAMEIRQLASSRQLTVMNGVSDANLQALAVPAAALGAVGYGYMWCKGISFADLMYVTQANMANVVASLKTNLEQVSETLAAVKRHLSQKIQSVDDKVEQQNDLTKEVKNQVILAREDCSLIEMDLASLHNMVAVMDERLENLGYMQDVANGTMLDIYNLLGKKSTKLPEMKQIQLPVNQKARNLLADVQTKGLKNVTEVLFRSDDTDDTDVTTTVKQIGLRLSRVNLKSRPLITRANSARC